MSVDEFASLDREFQKQLAVAALRVPTKKVVNKQVFLRMIVKNFILCIRQHDKLTEKDVMSCIAQLYFLWRSLHVEE